MLRRTRQLPSHPRLEQTLALTNADPCASVGKSPGRGRTFCNNSASRIEVYEPTTSAMLTHHRLELARECPGTDEPSAQGPTSPASAPAKWPRCAHRCIRDQLARLGHAEPSRASFFQATTCILHGLDSCQKRQWSRIGLVQQQG